MTTEEMWGEDTNAYSYTGRMSQLPTVTPEEQTLG